jgi:hypothetical protein
LIAFATNIDLSAQLLPAYSGYSVNGHDVKWIEGSYQTFAGFEISAKLGWAISEATSPFSLMLIFASLNLWPRYAKKFDTTHRKTSFYLTKPATHFFGWLIAIAFVSIGFFGWPISL